MLYDVTQPATIFPPPPQIKRKKENMKLFKKKPPPKNNSNSSRDSTVSEVYYQVHMTCVLHTARIMCPIVSLVYH